MFGLFKLSGTAKAVLWLWHNDPENWVVGTHAVVHQQTGVGVWTANSDWGIHVNYNIPDHDRPTAHSCMGRRLDLGKRDRKGLHRAIVRGLSISANREVQKQIADWGADRIPHPCPDAHSRANA